MTKRTVRVAVIGSGLAGLTAAYRLAKTPRVGDVEFEVHVFEKARSLGMDSHSVDVTPPGREKRRVDVPMRSFQGGYYPQLIALYKYLGVQFRQADFSYSFATVDSASDKLQDSDASQRTITTFMIYDGASGRKGISIPSSYFPSPHAALHTLWDTCVAHIAYMFSAFIVVLFSLRMVLHSLPLRDTVSGHSKHRPDSVAVKTTLFGLLHAPIQITVPRFLLPVAVRPPPHTTFREWVELITPKSPLSRCLGLDKQWSKYAHDILIPLFSAVCTASEQSVWDHPVEEFLDYAYLTTGTHHYVVQNGVREIVERMSSPLKKEHIHLASPIVSLVFHGSNDGDASTAPTIDIRCPNNAMYLGFDHIILATQANQASAILKTYIDSIPYDGAGHRHRDLVEQQIACLGSFQYSTNVVVNHTDPTIMPDTHRDRRDLNLMMARPRLRTRPSLGAAHEEEPARTVPPTFAMATHVLPGTSGVFQTTNPIVRIEESSVLSVARLERAVVTLDSKRALEGLWRERDEGVNVGTLRWGCAAVARGQLGRLQGAGVGQGVGGAKQYPGIWLCGSYAYGGIPLLEGCVVSARLVVEEGVWAAEGVDWRRESELCDLVA